jgi:hypothetical protein
MSRNFKTWSEISIFIVCLVNIMTTLLPHFNKPANNQNLNTRIEQNCYDHKIIYYLYILICFYHMQLMAFNSACTILYEKLIWKLKNIKVIQSLIISTKVLEFRDKKDFCLVLCILCDQVVVVWEVIDVLVLTEATVEI